MNKITIVALMLVISIIFPATPISADAPSIEMNHFGFSLDSTRLGLPVETGGTIHHRSDGVTEVYGKDGKLESRIIDSEAEMVTTPFGLKRATEIYNLPNLAKINYDPKLTTIYSAEGLTIVTILDDRSSSPRKLVNHGWPGSARAYNLTLDSFSTSWDVPSAPPNEGNVAFLFNGLEKTINNQGVLLQPVLQWNQAGYADEWSIESWALWPNNGLATGPVTVVNQYDTINGWVTLTGYPPDYGPPANNVLIRKSGTDWTGFSISGVIGGVTNIRAGCTMEVWRTDSDPFVNDDLPGDVLFYPNSISYRGNAVSINWVDDSPDYGLNLDLSFASSPGAWVYIDTPN
jgi:hypothetical protein